MWYIIAAIACLARRCRVVKKRNLTENELIIESRKIREYLEQCNQ